jgi:hypothetical protein
MRAGTEEPDAVCQAERCDAAGVVRFQRSLADHAAYERGVPGEDRTGLHEEGGRFHIDEVSDEQQNARIGRQTKAQAGFQH